MKPPKVKVNGEYGDVRSVDWFSTGEIANIHVDGKTLFAPSYAYENWEDADRNVYEVEIEEETK